MYRLKQNSIFLFPIGLSKIILTQEEWESHSISIDHLEEIVPREIKPIYKDEEKINRALSILGALNKTRISMLSFLDEERIVNEVKDYVDRTHSQTSNNLKILRDANMVFTKRDGKYITYTINIEYVDYVNKSIMKFINTAN